MINCYETKLDLKPFNRAGCRLKPTNRFYKDFVDKNDHICPFCGLNNYKNKFGKNREDLDHYLYKAEYPLAAANMWNLIPTCGECNQVYKKTLDVLFKESSRTRAYYPYERVHGVKVWIDLDTAKDKSKPEAWRVTFTPNEDTELDKVENWLRIYGIEERYRNDLACYFDKWIMDALLERESKFKNNRDFQKFMFSRAKKERQRYKKKLEPKAFLKCSFFVFVARRADNAFIGRYLYIFNADYK